MRIQKLPNNIHWSSYCQTRSWSLVLELKVMLDFSCKSWAAIWEQRPVSYDTGNGIPSGKNLEAIFKNSCSQKNRAGSITYSRLLKTESNEICSWETKFSLKLSLKAMSHVSQSLTLTFIQWQQEAHNTNRKDVTRRSILHINIQTILILKKRALNVRAGLWNCFPGINSLLLRFSCHD